jgi:hypothetical protein
MTLTLKPQGRGNWAALTITIKGRHIAPLNVAVGALLTIGGIVFRVCKVTI